MNPLRLSAIIASTTLSLACGIASAQQDGGLAPQRAPTGIEYVSGGVGDAQQQAMKNMMADYSLRLTFARPKTGDYLANVKVMIDQAGKGKPGTALLEAPASGPMLFAKLPAGDYRVRAELDGKVQTRSVHIGQGRAQDLVIYFPEV